MSIQDYITQKFLTLNEKIIDCFLNHKEAHMCTIADKVRELSGLGGERFKATAKVIARKIESAQSCGQIPLSSGDINSLRNTLPPDLEVDIRKNADLEKTLVPILFNG